MLLKQLKYFISIVEKGNFTEAAEENYISQSAISQQIQSLENELGYKLLIREKRTFTLTPAGKYIYHQSKNIIENIEDMQEKAKFIANTKNYSIKIGYLKNYTGKEMQKAIVEFNKRFPEVAIEIVSGTHDELGNKVFNNEIDLKFTDQRKAFSDEFVNFPVCTQYFSIRVPIYNELSNNDKITLEDIKDIPIIIIATKEQRESEANFYHNILGFKENFVFAENLEEANLLVACNKGILPIESMLKQAESYGTIKTIPLYYKQNQMSRK